LCTFHFFTFAYIDFRGISEYQGQFLTLRQSNFMFLFSFSSASEHEILAKNEMAATLRRDKSNCINAGVHIFDTIFNFQSKLIVINNFST
jgi:hypothetical protein